MQQITFIKRASELELDVDSVSNKLLDNLYNNLQQQTNKIEAKLRRPIDKNIDLAFNNLNYVIKKLLRPLKSYDIN